MSKKKGEQILQVEIDSSEQFEQVISKEGLVVIDVYQSWCGHAKQCEPVFKKIRVDLSDPLLVFYTANCDKIPELNIYKGRCEPCFLFYASKNLVAVVRGANAPVIIKTITEQLAYEHKCIKGEAQRKPITDDFILRHKADEDAKSMKQEVAAITETKPVTICIIKPDILANNKQDEVIAHIQQKGYTIVKQKKITFTEKMVHEFYSHRASDPEKFESLIKFMTSGPSIILALSRDDAEVIKALRADIGADKTPEEGEENLRTLYGTDDIQNAVHGSDSDEAASREMAYFFPKGLGVSKNEAHHTLALIRPSALAKQKDEILNKIKESGFKIAMTKIVQLDKEGAEEFYSEQKGQPFFDDLVNEMTSGPMMVLCLAKEDAVASWRNILGPKEKDNIKDAAGTMRNEFDLAEVPVNSLHGASTPGQAEKELAKFFPMEQTVALLKPGLTDEQKAEITKKIEDSGFIIATKKSEKLTEDIAKEMYKSSSDKPHYNELVSLMTSGETEVLVLSRENAIEGWREEIGDVDPSKAKESNPESLRATYGVDILNNAIHGASNKEQADHELNVLFPGVKFNEKGECC